MKTKLLIFAVIISLLMPSVICAAETRGLSIVAKDKATGKTGEVKLYNKSYAVIIGIDKYQNLPHDRQLRYAVKDAKGIEEVLRKKYRFDRIITLYNEQASRESILKTFMDDLASEMGEEDSLMIFWAGHGNQEKTKTGDIGYLIPYDGAPDKLYTNISMTQLKEDISKKIPAKHVFFVMDACYGGLLTATRSIDNKPRRDLAYLKEITKETVRQVLTAGGKGQEVLDSGRKGHSVFTGRLIELLEATDDFITANEIQAIIREKVYGDARSRNHTQTPAFGTLYGNGDFVFIPNTSQKLVDYDDEIKKMQKDLEKLTDEEKSAQKAQDEQRQREAARQKEIVEAKLRAEEIKRRQLTDDQRRLQEEAKERQQDETRMKDEEKRLAALKADIENRRKAVQAASGKTKTLAEAVAEIKRLAVQIGELEKSFAPSRKQIEARYEQKLRALDKQKKSEFESASEFSDRIEKEKRDINNRRDSELSQLNSRIEAETASLRADLKRLSEIEYTLDPATLVLEVGTYDIDRQLFPVSISNKTVSALPANSGKKGKKQAAEVQQQPEIKIAMNGNMPLGLRAEAQKFKQEWQNGLVQPEVTVRAGNGEIVKVVLANDASGERIKYDAGVFLARSEIKHREDEKKRQERERRENIEKKRQEIRAKGGRFSLEDGVIEDLKLGLQWVSAPDRSMNHYEAEKYAQNLSLAGGGWRLPTRAELKSLYDTSKSGNVDPVFRVGDKWVWTSELYSYGKWPFAFNDGYEFRYPSDYSFPNTRVLAVRSRRNSDSSIRLLTETAN